MAHPEHEALLAVQAADTLWDQCRHRRSVLAERAAVAAAEAEAVAAKHAYDTSAAVVADLATHQAELETKLGATEGRAASVEARLRSGESTAARDIVRWGEEVAHLVEQAKVLEDQAFEVLVQREEAEAVLAVGVERLASTVAAVRSQRSELSAAEAVVDAELAAVVAARTQAAQRVPAELLTRYEKMRAHLGGTAAARLVDGRCGGCHLALAPRDLDNARRAPEAELLACDACGRFLVRA